jgi:hypothetical protein
VKGGWKPRGREMPADETVYVWRNVPKKLLNQARAKCRQQHPPLRLGLKLLAFLRAWVEEDAEPLLPEDRTPRARWHVNERAGTITPSSRYGWAERHPPKPKPPEPPEDLF